MPLLLALALLAHAAGTAAQSNDAVRAQARAHKEPLLATLKDLVSIESGSRDSAGLAKLAALIAARFKELGAEVELVEPADVYKMEDTPPSIGKIVRATFRGKGTKKILLIAHMDTVYLTGMLAKQPFRLDGDRAYGLGISDESIRCGDQERRCSYRGDHGIQDFFRERQRRMRAQQRIPAPRQPDQTGARVRNHHRPELLLPLLPEPSHLHPQTLLGIPRSRSLSPSVRLLILPILPTRQRLPLVCRRRRLNK